MIQTFSDSESDDDEFHRFFSVCAENKINAMIARMREYDENFDRPEEFENEAVSMAIQQHGLRNCENHGSKDWECTSEINENHCNQNMVDDTGSNAATTSKISSSEILDMIQDYNDDDDKCSKSKQRKKHCDDSEMQNLVYKQNLDNFDFDDVEFINEAVEVAIKKKGLSSSSCNILK